MAKIKRILRKINPRTESSFDEQLWPVNVALLVLGSFLVGIVLVYLRFDDPRWYANAWTSLALIPLVVISTMVALRYVNNRVVRRAVQLSAVISLLIHVVFMLVMLRARLFADPKNDSKVEKQLTIRPKRVAMPDYHKNHLVDPLNRPKMEHEKPVDTPTPEPEAEPEKKVEKQETKPEPQTAEPQPVAPTPEPQKTTEPNVAKKQAPSETVPRLSEQQSKLSRHVTKTQPRPNQAADAPEVTRPSESPTPKMDAQASAVSRQAPNAQANVKTTVADPTTKTPQPTTQLSRRDPEPTPQPETTAKSTLTRQLNQPAVVPRSQVQTAEAPSVTKQTDTTALVPRTTNTTKQETTTSPQVAQKTSEPTPDSPQQTASKPERRQSEAEAKPVVAQTPTPVPNQRTKVTNRPDPATVASTASPSPSPSPSQTPTLTASESAVQRRSTETTPDRRQPTSEPTPATPTQQAVATVTRRETQTSPSAVPSATATPSLARQANSSNVAPTAKADAAQPNAVARQTQSSDVAPAATATRKQATDSPQVAKSSGEPTPASGPKSATALPTTIASRQQSKQSGPQVGDSANKIPGKTSAKATSNVVTNVADVATNSAPTQAADFNPQPSSSQVARQSAAPSAGATRSQTPLDAPQQSASNQIAQGSVQRAQASSQPALQVAAGSNASPARATRAAAAAASPVNVESPALATATQGQGDTSAQPARTALSKSLAGMAGAGRSANLDRATPAGDSPALVASGSAQRAKATQNTPDGPAFSPSAPALVGRSVAGADRPSSTLKAEQVDFATAGGTQVAGEINASSSAALTQANSNAEKGSVTAGKGNIEVDLGPTQVVAENGSGRASGGGQPELNFDSGSQQIARSKAGGAPVQAIGAAAVAAVPQAPAGGQAGTAPAVELNSVATATVRTEAGGSAAVSGGPSAAEKGTPTEVNAAPLLADAPISRADNSSAPAGGGAGGQPDVKDEDEEEKAKRLARSNGGGAPKLALSAAVVAEAPTSTPGDGASSEGMLAANSVAAATARTNLGNDLPSGVAGPATSEARAGEVGGGGGEVVGQVTVSRAESVDASPGAAVAGGGTSSPTRAATGSAFVANTQAAEVSIASAPASSGAPQGTPIEASGVAAAKSAGGVAGAVSKAPIGAAAGEVAIDAPGGQLAGTAVGPRQASSGTGDAPATTASTNAGAPLPRAEQSGLSSGVVSNNLVEIPQVAAVLAQADDDHLGGAMSKGSVVRRASGGLSVEIAMAEGPGGFGSELTPDVGIARRPASSESVDVQLRETRFVRQNVGGLPSVSTAAIITSDMFKRRIDRAQGKKDAGGGGLEPQTEDAIELGLSYLARQQAPNGSWSLRGTGEPVALASDTAATALSTLAFLGAGYHHREFKFKDTVRGGLESLIKNQRPDGDLFVPLDDESNRSVRLYSHAIATMALCEALLCTNDEDLKAPAQKAIDFIVSSQHKEQGGWRYTPGVSADTSVTGWMVVALKYGRDAGLKIPKETFSKVQRWVDTAQKSSTEKHLYRYNPYAPDTETQRHGRLPTKTMTAVGLVMRIYLGEKATASDLIRGSEYLEQNLPAIGSLRDPQRDTYYWYYATLFMHYMGGDHWDMWNRELHPLLVNTQVKDGPLAGSWDPRTPIPDRWALHAGRLYVTTMNLLSLEVRWRGLRQSDNANKTSVP